MNLLLRNQRAERQAYEGTKTEGEKFEEYLVFITASAALRRGAQVNTVAILGYFFTAAACLGRVLIRLLAWVLSRLTRI
jgi:hypothetical protein